MALLEAVQKSVADLNLRNVPLQLEFTGVASFGQQVIFANLVGDQKERLTSLAGKTKTTCVLFSLSLSLMVAAKLLNSKALSFLNT